MPGTLKVWTSESYDYCLIFMITCMISALIGDLCVTTTQGTEPGVYKAHSWDRSNTHLQVTLLVICKVSVGRRREGHSWRRKLHQQKEEDAFGGWYDVDT